MKKKNYAFAEHETIQAALYSLFRFQTLGQAQLITNRLAAEFLLAPKQSDPLDKRSFALWVRDLELTPEQKKQGYVGNFGKITIHKLPKGKWTLTLSKLDVPLKHHPHRKRVKQPHPNMGHAVLRAAIRNKIWPTMQEAADQLVKLHEEFPEISIPGINKLKILAYIKDNKGLSPVQKLELAVIKHSESEYGLTLTNLTEHHLKKRSLQPTPSKPFEHLDAPGPVLSAVLNDQKVYGFYTKLVSKRKKRKRK